MSAKHTPGPWMQHEGEVLAKNYGLICRSYYGKPDGEGSANARLIAAAPDLLDALQYLADEFRSVVNSEFATHRNPDPAKDDPAYSKAMAAIAKAIG